MERRLIVELRAVRAKDMGMGFGVDGALQLAVDPGFPETPLPRLEEERDLSSAAFGFDGAVAAAEHPATSIVRVTVPPGADARQLAGQLKGNDDVVGVFADVPIEPCLICPGSPPMGTDADVENLLGVAEMGACGMDGTGVTVAIVDTGVNIDYLASKGKTPLFDAARSWAPRAGLTPGDMPVGHGTMCAFDVCIAAPKCTLLDIALLTSNAPGGSAMDGLLSDAVRAYSHLLAVLRGRRRPGTNSSLVVNNSWGMFHPSWDFPVGDPGNYSDNANHPFNRIVATLSAAGADILFAAGNCGEDCPDGRCGGVTDNAIYGANSHGAVITVAGIDVSKERVGYSTKGPGRLEDQKPDISGFTHFAGSEVYSADGGTSAATPVVAGVVAAVRAKRPYDPLRINSHPRAIKALINNTAEELGPTGFDYDHGWGCINGKALKASVCPRVIVPPIDLCDRFPWLCRLPPDICRRYPWLCGPRPPFPRPPFPVPPRPPWQPGRRLSPEYEAYGHGAVPAADAQPVELSAPEAYWLGVAHGQGHGPAVEPPTMTAATPKCGCCGGNR